MSERIVVISGGGTGIGRAVAEQFVAAGGNVLLGADTPAEGSAGVAWHWTDNFRANVLTAVLQTESLTPLLTRPGGRAVFLSSIAAFRGSGAGSCAAAKVALHPYVFDKARELGEAGITVNAVAPGYVEDTEFFGAGVSQQRRRVLVDQTLNKRAGLPADVAATISWLASPESGHVTAQIVQINGGAELGR